MTHLRERIAVNTNDTIIGIINKGSFHFPIEFDMFDEHQLITEATFDTGCSHSLISIGSLNLGNNSNIVNGDYKQILEKLKEDALYDINIRLSIGRGVESKNIDIRQLKAYITKINALKRKLLDNKCDKEEARILLKNTYITDEMKSIITQNKNLIRYQFLAHNYTIDGVQIGDFYVNISFDLENVNLIGMHIIKELYTKIFPADNKIFLLAKKNTPVADTELDIVMDEIKEQIESLDDTILESNYIYRNLQ